MSEQSLIRSERRGPVAVITLNRPEKLNAWTAPMRESLIEAVRAADADPEVGAIVFTGTGRAFCAGQDLNETASVDPSDQAAAEEWIDSFDRLFRTVRDTGKPTIAAVNGVVAGSGFQFALLADLRIGHSGVRMGQPEVLSGIPSITGIWAMWSVLGRAKTTEFALTGELVEATEAVRLGLLTTLVEPEQVLEAAVDRAAKLAALPAGAVSLTKGRIRELEEDSLADAVRAAKRVHGEAYASGEPQREMAAFIGGQRR
ncbi:enoyl-CoA hydratase/isomerase family protein [Sciscionella sediminilitoris]|uniref:enoyl-CoA hydratase/isomerase family protein n=1 Tax=Sciscionella sediminilitoris TaxID=1445613 RepID=UPI0004DFC90B|nr:enoyl-CoA hydratase/isomerase family protein [Sciscionella sp. SE31]